MKVHDSHRVKQAFDDLQEENTNLKCQIYDLESV